MCMILVSVGAYSGGYTPAAVAVCAAERGSEASTDSAVDSSLAPVQMSAGAHVRDAQVRVPLMVPAIVPTCVYQPTIASLCNKQGCAGSSRCSSAWTARGHSTGQLVDESYALDD